MKLPLHLSTQIHVWLLMQLATLRTACTQPDQVGLDDTAAPRLSGRRRSDRGSVTIEQVIWAGAVIVIVGIVVAAITGYVTTQAGNIK